MIQRIQNVFGRTLSFQGISTRSRRRRRKVTIWRLLQLIGAGCLVVVVLTHVAETFKLFPIMGWGLPTSPGHYLDLISAVLGCTLLPLGFLGDVIVGKIQTEALPHFPLDSCNENVPEKRIPRNYALTTAPMSPVRALGKVSAHAYPSNEVPAALASRRRRVRGARR